MVTNGLTGCPRAKARPRRPVSLAGSITAAQFLQRFIMDDTPWAHVDIAGTVWTDKPGATWDKGASGFGVRLIDQLVADTIER